MLRNNNQEIIKKLSKRSFKVNKIRNIISIIAITLTTVLFTSLFTVGVSMMDAFNSYMMMEYGTSSHVQMQEVDKSQIDIIKNSESIDKDSIGIIKNIDSAKNPEFLTQTINLAVYDRQSVKNAINTEMVEGSLPKSKTDVVMPIEVLDMLKLPHKIGTNVSIEIPVVKDGAYTGENKTYKFKLSGYFTYKTATAIPLHDMYVSDDFYNEYKKDNEIGPLCITFNFKNDKNLEKQLEDLINKIKPYSGKYSVNPAFLDNQVTNTSEFIRNVLPVVLLVIVILTSGYLLIYNIFYISVVKDIKHYGLLKTIGTSPKQLIKLIINQANRLSLIGIPIGLFLGFIIGKMLLPVAMKFTTISDLKSIDSSNIAIFIGAIIFSYVTVRISCMKPAKLASSVSEVDATRYSDRDSNIKKKAKKGKSGSKIHKMALSNMFRNKKKALLVLMSMSLSCMIFLSVSTIISSSDPKRSAEGMMVGDIEIQHGEAQNAKIHENIIPIDEEFIKDVKNLDGVKSVDRIYKDYLGRVAYEGMLKEEFLSQRIDKEYVDKYWQGEDPRELAKFHKSVTLDISGVSSGKIIKEMIENNMLDYYGEGNIIEGKLDIEKFNKGGYIIIRGHEGSKVKVGDKIKLKYIIGNTPEEGYTTNELEVMAILDGADNFNMDVYVNEDDYKKIVPKAYVQNVVVNVDESVDEVEKNIEKLNDSYANPYTHISSKRTYIEEAKETQAMITIIGMSGVFIIGLIGVLNFINTMVTNIISRNQEFAMLEAVGMTKKQLKKMLVLEGMYYGVIITFINLTFGSLATFLGFNIMKLRYSVYTYPIEALLICTVLVLLVSVIVPLIVYKIISKESIVDRIRVSE
ncbi:ABC transporter permease [Romboutsia hominis]|uniref:ABC transporter permease n=1 Tax=Romboutsia hominis TaxID=1507512 RepID=UPI001F0709C3|nr:FtsX-like permease family protein [Romboutsia hominis]MCH1960113.1 hypothetical protein [Romboutsia hominis]MCH1969456.1 hypothetical protein [Romboutsia hominis]